jgi:hypothetical protein
VLRREQQQERAQEDKLFKIIPQDFETGQALLAATQADWAHAMGG